ncbi:hypothetical protein JTE90_024331 [Oedothorax gibbosus]|uniref:Uncharacterized protein n=1 Tax=Oedothorax gibbosus TaxID=931172 RepID=A0AAV6VWU5_9ARAC|nr:hypothetical protein JTE90_024331 [Oedothorax gibbosus]
MQLYSRIDNIRLVTGIMMLESKKELAVLETNLSSTSTKRSPFHLLSSIFSKKKSNSLDNDPPANKPTEFQSCSTANLYQAQHSVPKRCSTTPGPLDDYAADANFFSSATRRKNLKIDLETLHLSRQDNPYLKTLERFSLPEDTILTCADLNSLAEKALLQSEWHIDADGDVDIHQHLVRSPPPQFPQNITHFIYSQANSPKRQANQSNNTRVEDYSPEKRKKPLNPVHNKKETGTLDPGIREVLEYQKSQLIAGLQHSLNIGQAKFGTAPAHYTPVQVKARWTQDSGSKTLEKQVPHATSSLPGLTSCYFEMEGRRATLGPIRIGRTLSDSICLDNKLRKIGSNQ